MRASVWIGLGVGIATGLWMWIEYALGFHTTKADVGRITGFLSIIIPIVGMMIALRRARASSGDLTFLSGMKHVLAVSAFATLSMAAMSSIYISSINPEWLAQAKTTAAAFILQGAVAALIGGVVVGVVVWAILRIGKKKVAIS